jgi:alpha-maltose-1-phosphate synthase
LDRLRRTLPAWSRPGWANRRLVDLPASKLRIHPLGEVANLIQERLGGGGSEARLHHRNKQFQWAIPGREIKRSDVVIGFDTSSWLLARRVKLAQGKFILDQSIGHPIEKEEIFQSLRERYPAWSVTVPRKRDSHIAEEQEEHQCADLIVAPSKYVKDTLTSHGVPASKVHIVPFGTDLDLFRPNEAARAPGRVVFLFVGSISARKGLPVLLDAWRSLQTADAELWLVGPGALPRSEAAGLPQSIRLLGPKGRDEVAQLMQMADVFVFPSFFEGLAQVQIEALASGLPVISTRQAGAEDLINSGQNGFVLPAGDAAQLAQRMQQLLVDRELLSRMRRTVIGERDKLSWAIYGDRWARVLDELT